MNIGTVVNKTRTENIYVQMGSAIKKSGLTLIIIAEIITPTLYIISPNI
jgi:hypothetical protein